MKKIISVLLVTVMGSIYAQSILSGTYCVNSMLGSQSDCITLNEDGTFESEKAGDVATISYGKGHYFITEDSLTLNYDLTDIKIAGYHILKPYKNLTTTPELKIKVFDFDKNPLPNVNVDFFYENNTHKMKETNEKGELFYQLPLKNELNRVSFSTNFATPYDFSFDKQYSYEIEVYLSKIPGYEMGYAIKGAIQKYKIFKKEDNYFIVPEGGGQESSYTFKKIE